MKPTIFIGSSSEAVQIANAVQQNLERDFEVTVWNQNVFRLSEYLLDSLLRQLSLSDFGVFVLAADDLLLLRGRKHSVARDNVIYELGLYTGRLGRHRVFALVPKGEGKLKLPSDLTGLIYAEYDVERRDGNIVAALGPACNQIRSAVSTVPALKLDPLAGVQRAGLFVDFDEIFQECIKRSHHITLCFIHSRRWRENYDSLLKDLLRRRNGKLTVYLPDLDNAALRNTLRDRFDDGPHIPRFVADAYRYFLSLKEEYPKSVHIKLYRLLMSYSIYKFDDQYVVALYPNNTVRKPVATWLIQAKSAIANFLQTDLTDLTSCKHSRDISVDDLKVLIKKYR